MIAVTFALRDESGDFLRAVQVRRSVGREVGSWCEGEIESSRVLIWHVGVGRSSATREARKLLEEARPRLVICAGYAGGLSPSLNIGDICVDWRSFARPERFAALPRMQEGGVLTVEQAAESVEAKAAIAASGAIAVDMETEVLANAFDAAGIPVIAVRAISDRCDEPLPVPMEHWFSLEKQRPKPLALLRFLTLHPATIWPFVRFVRGLGPARRNLAAAVAHVIRELAPGEPAHTPPAGVHGNAPK